MAKPTGLYPVNVSIPSCESDSVLYGLLCCRRRLTGRSIHGNSVGKVVADTGAFLKDLDTFDSLEFGITAKDARLMPLSTRKLLETAFLSLQDSGIDYRGKNVGCFMSGVAHDMFAISGHVSHCCTFLPNVWTVV